MEKTKLQKTLSNPKMIQFTQSLSAINSMSASVGIIRAKNAFLRKLSKESITQEDVKREGEKEWQKIEQSYKPELKWEDIDFSDLNQKTTESSKDNPTLPRKEGAPPPPPPPPPSRPISSITRTNISKPSDLLFKDQLSSKNRNKSDQSAEKSEQLPRISENETKLVKLHWKPIPSDLSGHNLWSQLPQSKIDKEELKYLFQRKENKLSSNDVPNKPKEVSVLEQKRSNQINIAIKSLPSLGVLKRIILKMDDTSMNRDGVEKLQSLIGSVEEIAMIKEAQKDNPELPLGHAEQFLLMLHSISSLKCRLNLWAFKLDFHVMEEDITQPLKYLKTGIDKVKGSETFSLIMSYTLAIGNILNRSNCDGFQLEYLTKLADVKDTETKKSILYHTMRTILETEHEMKDLAQEFEDFSLVAVTNFEEIQVNLRKMEDECKRSLGYLKIGARYSTDTQQLVNDFLMGATKRILTMKKIYKLVLQKHAKVLDWFGIPKHLHSDYTPMNVAGILLNFAQNVNFAKKQVLDKNNEIEKKENEIKNNEKKKKENETVQLMKSSSEQSLKRKGSIETIMELRVSKNLDDPQSSGQQSNSSLEDYLETANTELKMTKGKRRPCSRSNSSLEDYLETATTELKKTKGKRRPCSRRSSTASEGRYSRTVSRQLAEID